MEKRKTTLKVVCAWCGEPMGEKDGQGVEGTSHGICKTCARKEYRKLRKARIDQLIGRVKTFIGIISPFARRRARIEIAEFERQAREREENGEYITKDPNLHARVMLIGKRFVHYTDIADIFELADRFQDTPEFKCKWN